MKKPTGKNNWRILLLCIALATSCACVPNDTYTTRITYENTLQQSLKLEIFRDYHGEELDRTLDIAPGDSESTEITVFKRDNVFNYIGSIRLTFEDGKSILYEKHVGGESQATPMRMENYKHSEDGMHMEITEDHYLEAIASEDKKGDS